MTAENSHSNLTVNTRSAWNSRRAGTCPGLKSVGGRPGRARQNPAQTWIDRTFEAADSPIPRNSNQAKLVNSSRFANMLIVRPPARGRSRPCLNSLPLFSIFCYQRTCCSEIQKLRIADSNKYRKTKSGMFHTTQICMACRLTFLRTAYAISLSLVLLTRCRKNLR